MGIGAAGVLAGLAPQLEIAPDLGREDTFQGGRGFSSPGDQTRDHVLLIRHAGGVVEQLVHSDAPALSAAAITI